MSVLTTADYMQTAKLLGGNRYAGSYQRPIQWMLTSTEGGQAVQHLVISSPHEAQRADASHRESKYVYLHLYARRPKSTGYTRPLHCTTLGSGLATVGPQRGHRGKSVVFS